VGISSNLAALLEHIDVARKAEALAAGRERSELVFPRGDEQPFDQSRLSEVFKRILKAVALTYTRAPAHGRQDAAGSSGGILER